MRKLLFTAVLGLFLSQIKAQTVFAEQKVGHVFYLSLPTYLAKTTELNDAAALQCMNAAKEAYIIVIEDSKADLVLAKSTFTGAKDFMENFMTSYNKDATDRMVSSITEGKTANGFNMAQSEITYTTDATKIWMLVTIVENQHISIKYSLGQLQKIKIN